MLHGENETPQSEKQASQPSILRRPGIQNDACLLHLLWEAIESAAECDNILSVVARNDGTYQSSTAVAIGGGYRSRRDVYVGQLSSGVGGSGGFNATCSIAAGPACHRRSQGSVRAGFECKLEVGAYGRKAESSDHRELGLYPQSKTPQSAQAMEATAKAHLQSLEAGFQSFQRGSSGSDSGAAEQLSDRLASLPCCDAN